jgi:hypothetical protein
MARRSSPTLDRMRASVLTTVAAALLLGCAQNSVLNAASTCHVAEPPELAGENAAHAQLFKVYPRRGSVGGDYSGCQTIWLYPPGEAGARSQPTTVMRYYFQRGNVVAVQFDGKVCKYTPAGAPLPGNTAECPDDAPEAMPSLPAGCVVNALRSASPTTRCNDEG